MTHASAIDVSGSPFPELETMLAHAGQNRDLHGRPADGEPLIPAIAQSTTFCRDGVASAAEHCYSRQSNPTVSALEHTLGQLENAPPAVCYSTGLGAEAGLFLTLLRAGDHVVCARALYGGTTRILQQVFPGLGVRTDFVDATDIAAVAQALRPNTRLVFLETPANPTLELTDVRAIATLAHGQGALVAVDNTFMTPLLQQPLDLGADVSVASTTKFVEGHSTALGGALVTRDEELLERLRFVRTCTGGIQTPFNAWLTIQGVKTLSVRLERQCQTAQQLAEWLAEQPQVARVHYPSLANTSSKVDETQHALAAAQHHRGQHGAVLAFELKSGLQGAQSFAHAVQLCRLVEHVGGVETLLTHSATMTHGGVPRDQRIRAGVTDGLLRLSVGLEPASAIAADLALGLRASDGSTGAISEPGIQPGTSPTYGPIDGQTVAHVNGKEAL